MAYKDSEKRPVASLPRPLSGELRLSAVLSSYVGDEKRLVRLRQCLESVVHQTQILGWSKGKDWRFKWTAGRVSISIYSIVIRINISYDLSFTLSCQNGIFQKDSCISTSKWRLEDFNHGWYSLCVSLEIWFAIWPVLLSHPLGNFHSVLPNHARMSQSF